MNTPRPIVVDFEGEDANVIRPVYPPRPTSVSIEIPGHKTEFLAWGHPIGNNCTKDFARRRLKKIWEGGDPLLFHHSKFDREVGEKFFDLKPLPWERTHDTLFLAFLNDPHSPNFQLKPLAERHLKMKPVERDKLKAWIVGNIKGATDKNWGAFISKAPAPIVGQYAGGDTARTSALFRKLYTDIARRNMLIAYDRERRLMPIMLATEQQGVCVDMKRLKHDVLFYGGKLVGEDDEGKPVYEGGVIGDLDARVRKILNAPGLNVGKTRQLGAALIKAKKLVSVVMTKPSKAHPEGQISVAKGALLEGIEDPKLLALLLYRGALATCVQTFMRVWLRQAQETGGRIHTSWNQVRQSDYDDELIGARTGRLSSSPNFQNIPIKTSPNYERLVKCLKDAKLLDKLAPFPMIRSYLGPDPGGVFLNRDYSQQELRILGHYEGAVLQDQYNSDPWLDVHDLAQKLINDMLGTDFSRRSIKDTGFGLIYGMGIVKLAKKIEQDSKTAKTIREAYLQIFPGLGDLDTNLKRRAAAKEPIRTWGGREYYCEEPSYSEKYGRWMTYEYKLLNQLIQGSAADNTKQATINYDAHPKRQSRFLLTVHDEFLGSTRTKNRDVIRREMYYMREAMEACKFDVPMLSEGEWGGNWANLKTFDEKGKELFNA